MKIGYFHGGRDVPSVRFRMPLFRLLENRGHDCGYFSSHPSRYSRHPLLGWRAGKLLRYANRMRDIEKLKRSDYDCVVLETELFHTANGTLEGSIRKHSKRLVYDIDDAVFLLFPAKIREFAATADHVIVANTRLAEWASQYTSNISIIPTCIDLEVYAPKSEVSSSGDGPTVIGWVGSPSNLCMLEHCAEALRVVAREHPLEFRVISSNHAPLQKIDFSGVKVHRIDIDACDLIDELHRLDVGVMPLPASDRWSWYKCNAKMIQYMAVGLAAIGSDVGFNRELVRHGQNGMLAANKDEWIECLRSLIRSPEQRQAIGKQARETIESRFTVQRRIDEYERAILGTF